MLRLPYPRRCRHCQTWQVPHALAEHEAGCREVAARPTALPPTSPKMAEAARLLETLGPVLGGREIRRRQLPWPTPSTPPTPTPAPPPTTTSSVARPPLAKGWREGRELDGWSDEALLHQPGLTHVDQLRASGFRVADIPPLVEAGHAPRLHELGVTPAWLRTHGRTKTLFGGVREFNAAAWDLRQDQWRSLGVTDPVQDLGMSLAEWVKL